MRQVRSFVGQRLCMTADFGGLTGNSDRSDGHAPTISACTAIICARPMACETAIPFALDTLRGRTAHGILRQLSRCDSTDHETRERQSLSRGFVHLDFVRVVTQIAPDPDVAADLAAHLDERLHDDRARIPKLTQT